MKKPTRESLVNTFCSFADFFPSRHLESFVKNMKKFLEDNDDEEVRCVLLVTEAWQHNIKTNKPEESYVNVAPVFEYYNNKANWSFTDLTVLASAITFAATYDQAKSLAKKIIDALDNYKHEGTYAGVMFAVRFNVTARLLWVVYIDIPTTLNNINLKDVMKCFKEHYNKAVEICERYNIPAIKAVLDIRKGTIFDEFDVVDEGLRWLYKNKAYKWYDSIIHEVADFLYVSGLVITKWQLDIVIGSRVKRLREENGVSLARLAEYINISESALARAERGLTSLTVVQLYRAAAYLNKNIEYFYPIVDTCNEAIEAGLHAGMMNTFYGWHLDEDDEEEED